MGRVVPSVVRRTSVASNAATAAARRAPSAASDAGTSATREPERRAPRYLALHAHLTRALGPVAAKPTTVAGDRVPVAGSDSPGLAELDAITKLAPSDLSTSSAIVAAIVSASTFRSVT